LFDLFKDRFPTREELESPDPNVRVAALAKTEPIRSDPGAALVLHKAIPKAGLDAVKTGLMGSEVVRLFEKAKESMEPGERGINALKALTGELLMAMPAKRTAERVGRAGRSIILDMATKLSPEAINKLPTPIVKMLQALANSEATSKLPPNLLVGNNLIPKKLKDLIPKKLKDNLPDNLPEPDFAGEAMDKETIAGLDSIIEWAKNIATTKIPEKVFDKKRIR
jgi:hypothetical protein